VVRGVCSYFVLLPDPFVCGLCSSTSVVFFLFFFWLRLFSGNLIECYCVAVSGFLLLFLASLLLGVFVLSFRLFFVVWSFPYSAKCALAGPPYLAQFPTRSLCSFGHEEVLLCNIAFGCVGLFLFFLIFLCSCLLFVRLRSMRFFYSLSSKL